MQHKPHQRITSWKSTRMRVSVTLARAEWTPSLLFYSHASSPSYLTKHEWCGCSPCSKASRSTKARPYRWYLCITWGNTCGWSLCNSTLPTHLGENFPLLHSTVQGNPRASLPEAAEQSKYLGMSRLLIQSMARKQLSRSHRQGRTCPWNTGVCVASPGQSENTVNAPDQ